MSSPGRVERDFAELNTALEQKAGMTGYRWVNSVENIFNIVISGMGAALTNPKRSGYVIQLMDVVKLFDFPLWMQVKEILLDTLLGTTPDGNYEGPQVNWDDEDLYWSLLDRY